MKSVNAPTLSGDGLPRSPRVNLGLGARLLLLATLVGGGCAALKKESPCAPLDAAQGLCERSPDTPPRQPMSARPSMPDARSAASGGEPPEDQGEANYSETKSSYLADLDAKVLTWARDHLQQARVHSSYKSQMHTIVPMLASSKASIILVSLLLSQMEEAYGTREHFPEFQRRVLAERARMERDLDRFVQELATPGREYHFHVTGSLFGVSQVDAEFAIEKVEQDMGREGKKLRNFTETINDSFRFNL